MEHEHHKPEVEMPFNKGDLLFRLSQSYPRLPCFITHLLCTHSVNRSQKTLPGIKDISFQQGPKRSSASSRNILQFLNGQEFTPKSWW